MASTSRRRIRCSECDKTGILSCHGCKNDFCYIHVTEHREELNLQMEEIIIKRDHLQQTVTEQKAKPDGHPLLERIDQWEKQSIIKIRQSARDIRRNLLNILDIRRTKAADTLSHLTRELNNARKDNDYVETDLKEWMNKLKQLKKDLLAAQTIRFAQGDDDSTLISKIFINDTTPEYFGQVTGDIEIIQDGKVIEHGQTNSIAIARSRGEYASKQHRFRFEMAKLGANHGFYFGIVSKSTSDHSILRAIPTTRSSRRASRVLDSSAFSCRDDGYGFLYFSKMDFDIKINDTFQLLIDCDQRKVYLKHEQSQNQLEAMVDINKCPFPWQFFLCLSYAGDRVLLD